MKIDEIIKKSIEIPGISIKRGEFSAELILKERDGKGSMTFFPLFPGVTLAYIFVNSPAWTCLLYTSIRWAYPLSLLTGQKSRFPAF